MYLFKSKYKRLAVSLMMGTCLSGVQYSAHAADDENKDVLELEEIFVFAEGSRLPADITTIPGTVTIIDLDQIKDQATISSDLGRILAASVPGMSLSSNDGNNFAQTLRGRKPAFFIDGIPQSAELRGGGRDLRILHPSVLQRVEVINGATSIYGLGGSGGVVNYITKRPSDGDLEMFSEVGLGSSLSNISDDGLEFSVTQSASGKQDKIDFVASITYQTRGLYFDGDGDPIPPDPNGQTGIADMDEWSFFGKVGVEITPNIRFEVMGMRYDAQVDTNYTVGQGSFAQDIKSIAVPKEQNNFNVLGLMFDFVGAVDPSTENNLVASSLIFDEVMGSRVKLQAFYKDSEFVWRHLDYILPGLAGFPPDGSQLVTKNSKRGARLDVETPLNFGETKGILLWGVDFTRDKTGEQLIDGRIRTSTVTQDSLSAFAQLQFDVTSDLHFRGGLRYDDFKLKVPSFQTLDNFDPAVLHNIVGADLDYTNLALNVGATYDITEELNVFAGWSQGFSIGNVLRTIGGLRPATPGPTQSYYIDDLGKFTEPVSVNSYEVGFRYGSQVVSGSVTGFYNTSKLGASFDSVTLETTRAPERIWGVELAANVNITDAIRAGGNLTVMDSKTDADSDGVYEGPLDYSRVPPTIMFTYVEMDFLEGWRARLQATTLFDESRFDAPFGTSQRDIEGYTLFDLLVSGPVLGGTLSMGIENLFNNQYTPFVTYMNCSDSPFFDAFCNTQGVGARGTLKYSIKY